MLTHLWKPLKRKEAGVIESPLHRIIRKTGRKPCVCGCKLCQQQCHHPCLGTPQDIEKLIDAGFGDKLALTDWAVGILMGVTNAPIPMIQATSNGGWCVFFHDGKCELHDLGLKPTEGRLSHHSTKIDTFTAKKSIAWNVAKEWFNPENREVVRRLARKFGMLIERNKDEDNE